MVLTGETTAEEAAQAIQERVDELRENPDIPKFTSVAPGATPEATPAS
jgi:5,10-methylene-tetrahydrofolate dehydrogenase/methenyl tetrahydrofolate cyclohydrolase